MVIAHEASSCTSDGHKCLEGPIFNKAGMSRLDFQKKSTRHAALKVVSKGRFKSRTDRLPNKMSEVIGNFCTVLSPFWLLRPLRIEEMYQLFTKGLGNPASRCIILVAFKYCRTDAKQRRPARNAIKFP